MRVGTIFTGTVDALGGQSIQTKFFMLGVPLVPMSSWYVLEEQGRGIRGFEIPLDGRSVLLAYVRWASALVAIGLWIANVLDRYDANYVPPVVATALWIAFTFFTGRVGGDERLRRLVFGRLTGLYANPAVLPENVHDEILKALKAKIEEAGGDVTALALERAPERVRLAAWAYAACAAPRDPGFQDVALRLWAGVTDQGLVSPAT